MFHDETDNAVFCITFICVCIPLSLFGFDRLRKYITGNELGKEKHILLMSWSAISKLSQMSIFTTSIIGVLTEKYYSVEENQIWILQLDQFSREDAIVFSALSCERDYVDFLSVSINNFFLKNASPETKTQFKNFHYKRKLHLNILEQAHINVFHHMILGHVEVCRLQPSFFERIVAHEQTQSTESMDPRISNTINISKENALQIIRRMNELKQQGYDSFGVLIRRRGESMFSFVALVPIYFRPLSHAAKVISHLHSIGIKTVLFSRDNRASCLSDLERLAMYGSQDDSWDMAGLSVQNNFIPGHSPCGKLVLPQNDVTVYYNTLPSDEVLIIQNLKMQGHEVGVTGCNLTAFDAFGASECGLALEYSDESIIARSVVYLLRPGIIPIYTAIVTCRRAVRLWQLFCLHRLSASVYLMCIILVALGLFGSTLSAEKFLVLSGIVEITEILALFADRSKLSIGNKPESISDNHYLVLLLIRALVFGLIQTAISLLWRCLCISRLYPFLSLTSQQTAMWLQIVLSINFMLLSIRTMPFAVTLLQMIYRLTLPISSTLIIIFSSIVASLITGLLPLSWGNIPVPLIFYTWAYTLGTTILIFDIIKRLLLGSIVLAPDVVQEIKPVEDVYLYRDDLPDFDRYSETSSFTEEYENKEEDISVGNPLSEFS